MLNLKRFFHNDRLQFFPYKIFECGDRNFIITNTISAIFEIDSDVSEVIQCEGKTFKEAEPLLLDRFGEKELEELFEKLEENYIIQTADNMEKLNVGCLTMQQKINSVTLMVCQECNLRCVYCYGEGGEYHDRGIMDFETGKRAILFGFENCEKDSLSIVFFGGEPLMQFALIRQWVDFAKDEAKKRSMKVGFSITTNATLITDETASFFKVNHFGITVSIDGCEDKNDKNRFYANGSGAYKNILKGVDVLQNHGIDASARGTITSSNMDMLESWKHLNGLMFKSVHLAPAVNLMKETDLSIYMQEEQKMVDYFLECLKCEDYESISKMHNIKSYLSRIHNGGRRKTCCGAQENMIAVDKNGDIYPCHRFVSTKEMCIGNVVDGWNKEKMEVIREALQLSSSKCSDCWAVVLCGGGCPFENYMDHEDICKPNSFACKSRKRLLTYMVKKYLELSEDEREQYFDVPGLQSKS